MPNNVVPEFGKGIRLFQGDALKLDRKFGVQTPVIAAALEKGPIRLTVTGTGRSEQSEATFVRFFFECPLGVFATTIRDYDLPEGIVTIARPDHKRLTLLRQDMESFVIHPRGRALDAANDLVENGILIDAEEQQGDEGRGRGNSKIRIFASPIWNIARSELVGKPRHEKGPSLLAKPEVAALSAFQRAAEELLPDSLLESVRLRAQELVGRMA